jgi:dTDP-4-dehydrorhamnose 3,5-epimerase
MEKLKKIPTSLPDIFIIEPTVFSDSRGFFYESYNRRDMELIGIRDNFVQDNQSCSAKGVVRGLHFQIRHPQGKLVRVLRGSIYDVVVDIRKGSPTFGKAIGFEISAQNFRMLWIPVGFAHGFLSLEDHTDVLYKTTDFYNPEYDAGIRWNDPDLAINWPLAQYGISSAIISEKDAKLPLLKEFESPFECGDITS